MSVSASLLMQMSVSETLEAGVPAASNPIVKHTGFNLSGITLNANSTPPATKVAAINPALVAGAYTIDLTSLAGTNGATVVGTGLKVQAILLLNPAANAAMTFKFGASNPYNLGGDAAWRRTIGPGAYEMIYDPENNPDIASGAKNIDVSGTGTQSFKALILMG